MSPRPSRGAFEGRRRAGSGASRAPAATGSRRAGLPHGWADRSYLVLDVETTGLDPKSCRVVELGALLFVPAAGLATHRSIDRLVNPGIAIPSFVSSIHGIHDRDVADAPSFAEVAGELAALAEGAILVAHNAPFDLAFLRMEFAMAGRPALSNAMLDTVVLARRAFPGLPSYSLGRLAASLGIDVARSHRALDDALVCARIFVDAAARLSGDS